MSKQNNPSRVEIAKAIKQLKAVTTKDQHARIAAILQENSDAVTDDAVEGLSQEDEFLLLSLLMGTATHLAPLDQRPSIATRIAAPDLIARFQPPFSDYAALRIPRAHHSGFRCLIEVKSTKNDKFKMGGSALQRLRDFADNFSLPLVFAVRFMRFGQMALWAIVEDSDRTKTSLTVDVGSVNSGLRPMLWCDHGYLLPPGTSLQMSFDSATARDGMHSKAYGTLVGLQLINPKGRHVIPESHVPITALFLNGYLPEEVGAQVQGTVTHVAYRFHNNMLTVADSIFAMNRVVRDDEGNIVHDACRVLRELADGQDPTLFNRSIVETLANHLCGMGAMWLMGLGGPERNYELWVKTGGKPPQGCAGPSKRIAAGIEHA